MISDTPRAPGVDRADGRGPPVTEDVGEPAVGLRGHGGGTRSQPGRSDEPGAGGVLVQHRLPVERGLPGRLDQHERPPFVRRIGWDPDLPGDPRAGCQVPGQLLIAAGVDSVQSREGDPPVTALDLHPERQAEVAVEMLLARLDDGDGDVAAPRHIPATLRVRASTGAR
jgi:hypothetical protein